jgi:tetratricopeptide (TPR) repeat protein
MQVRVTYEPDRGLAARSAAKASKVAKDDTADLSADTAKGRSNGGTVAGPRLLGWLSLLGGQLPPGEARRGPLILVAFIVIIALTGSLYTIWQMASPLLWPDARSAEQRKLDEILDRLKAIQASAGRGAAGPSIDAQTREALERLLGSADTDQRVAAELLRAGRIDEAINHLVATGNSKLGLSGTIRGSGVGDLYTAALLVSYRSLDSAKRLAIRIISVAPSHVPTRVLLAQIHLNQGDPAAAADALRPVVNDRSLSTRHSTMISNSLGLISIASGDLDSAERFFRIALSSAKKAQDRHLQAAVLGNLGMVYDNRGDTERAKTYFNLSLALNEGKDATLSGNAHCNLGMALLAQNNLAGAEREFQQALDIFGYAVDKTCLPNTLNGLGGVYAFRDDHKKAAEYFRRGKLEADRLGATENRILLRINLAQSLYETNSEYSQDLLEALQMASFSPTNSKAFSYHEEARDRLLEYAAAKRDGKFDSLRRALKVVDAALTRVPATERQGRHDLSVDGAFFSCALGDQPSFKRFMRLSGQAALDPADPVTGKIPMHVSFSDFIGVTEGVVSIQKDFNRDCLGRA